jgi:hypothetical protein
MSDKKPVPVIVRRPGSQVAPNEKPYHRPNAQTASTHSRVPLHVATAGKLYRVRDRADDGGNATLWGELLSHDDALKLKERIVGGRQSKTARVEEMTPVEITEARNAQAAEATDFLETEPAPDGDVAAPDGDLVELDAPTLRVPGRTEASVDFTWVNDLVATCGEENGKWAGELIRLSTERGIRLSKLDEEFIHVFFQQMRLVKKDSQLDDLKKRALAAAAPVARQAQIRVEAKPKKPPVISDPPKPPPSPLSDELAELDDGGPAELPEEPTLESGEVQDLSSEVGGAPTGDDVVRARKQAELDAEAALTLAKEEYQTAARTSEGGPWPFWEALGEFEHAAWRYYVVNGGERPVLTKEPRKPVHSMGVVP